MRDRPHDPIRMRLPFGRLPITKSAIQQIENLRYGLVTVSTCPLSYPSEVCLAMFSDQVNSRGSKANSSGCSKVICLKSGWAGLSRKFGSPEMVTLGNARIADRPARTQASPKCLVETG